MWEMEPHRGWSDGALAKGVNTFESRVTYQAVAEALDLDYVPVEEALAA